MMSAPKYHLKKKKDKALTCRLSSAFFSLSFMSSSDKTTRFIFGGETGRRGLSLEAGFRITSKARLPDFGTGLSAVKHNTKLVHVIHHYSCSNYPLFSSSFYSMFNNYNVTMSWERWAHTHNI